MGKEKKSGANIETKVAPSLKEKFRRKCMRNGTNMSQVLRDLIQGYVKK